MEQDHVMSPGLDEAVKAELATTLRWSWAQFFICIVLQVFLAIMATLHVRNYFAYKYDGKHLDPTYVRLTCWSVFNIVFNVIVLIWIYRYVRAGRLALLYDEQAYLRSTFRRMRKAVAWNVLLLIASVLYYGYLIFDMMRHSF